MSSRRKRARRHHKRAGVYIARAFIVVALLVAAVMLIGAVSAYATARSWLTDLPDYTSPEAFRVAQATKIYSADGVLLARLYLENRTVVPISQVSTDLANAVISIEDERFYEHDGVDFYGIARAAVKDIAAGSFEEGASTITQQCVDNTLLRDERTDRTLRYKLREAYLALELEKVRSKEEILELYLNTVYFGEGAYGAQAAARAYFNKDAKDLTLAEAALLGGLPQAPSRLSPYENPDGALERRRQVLDRMLVNGWITQAQFDEAVATPLQLEKAPEPDQGIYRAHYFVAHVKKLLQAEFSQSLVFQGGLTVYTTIDTRLQGMAEASVNTSLGQKGDPDCALVSIDPRDGSIKAMVGGRNYTQNKFNLATQGRRQPGSSFKTFVLVAALEEGHPPNRYIDSSSPAAIPAKPVWNVSNSEGSGRGMVTLETATRSSINTCFARLIWELNDSEKTGAQKVAEMANRMGIASEIPPYPSIALGSQNVTPLEMASAYGTLATNGVHFAPMAITRVLGPDGEVVFEANPEGREAISPPVAYAATQVLKGVISGGTARRAQIGRPAAGKTGTSQNYRDAWFVGYTPQLVTSVWVGFYQTETPMRSVHGARGFGGTLAAPIWAKFMKQALAGQPELDFQRQDKPKYTWKPAWDGRMTVPKLVGMAVGTAQTVAKEAGFGVNVVLRTDPRAPAGIVVGQSPGGGEKVKQGATITLYVSKGQPAPTPTPQPQPPQPPPTPPPSEPTSPSP